MIYEQKTTSSPFSWLVIFFTNWIFLWTIDDPSLNSSFLFQFVGGIMRPYHSSNQHKHFNKSNVMNALCHYSSRLKKNILHFMIQIIIKMASITHVPHLFSMKHIFLEGNTAFLFILKKERNTKFEFEQSSWRHKNLWIKRMCVDW